jgi:hypothetical protein
MPLSHTERFTPINLKPAVPQDRGPPATIDRLDLRHRDGERYGDLPG